VIETTFDDEWFFRHRRWLLAPLARDVDTGRPLRAPIMRACESVRRGSAARHRSDDHRRELKEQTLSRLAPRHAGAVRAHLAFYRACLESTALVAADDLIHSAVQIEWLWYSSGFKAFYRDHLAHVMKVAATALHLIQDPEGPLSRPAAGAGSGAGEPARQPAAVWAARQLADGELGCEALRCTARRLGNSEESIKKPDFWRYAMLEAMKLAGLLHDMAYPSIMARKVLRAVEPANAFYPFEVQPAHALDRALAAVSRTLAGAPFNRGKLPDSTLAGEDREICAQVLEESHSLQAAVSILGFRDQADRYWRLDPFEAFVIEWAALATELHDYDKLFEQRPQAVGAHGPGDAAKSPLTAWLARDSNLDAIRPCFSNDPVSYLVAFADQIQDFGRLHYDWRRHPSAGDDELGARLVYPWRSVTLRVEGSGGGGSAPEATLLYAPDGGSDLWERKKKDLGKIFGESGWLRSSGLIDRFKFELAGSP
jgi:hypothetical protein